MWMVRTWDQVGLAEIDIHGGADAAPVRHIAAAIHQKVVYGDEVKDDAGAFQGRPFSAPIAEHVGALRPRRGFRIRRGLGRSGTRETAE